MVLGDAPASTRSGRGRAARNRSRCLVALPLALLTACLAARAAPRAALGTGGGGSPAGLDGLVKQDNNGWRITLFSPETEMRLRQMREDYYRRSGGKKTAVGAAVVGGLSSVAIFQRVPVVPATLGGALAGAWAVQLPAGNRLGESARQIGSGAASFWQAISEGGSR
uniref:Uncharacterized protein n=1 Tax=Alexandrium catenella TaxID=2925 RepID=A0A7S1S2C4_ALECA